MNLTGNLLFVKNKYLKFESVAKLETLNVVYEVKWCMLPKNIRLLFKEGHNVQAYYVKSYWTCDITFYRTNDKSTSINDINLWNVIDKHKHETKYLMTLANAIKKLSVGVGYGFSLVCCLLIKFSSFWWIHAISCMYVWDTRAYD